MARINIEILLLVACCVLPASVGANGIRACANVAMNNKISVNELGEKNCPKYIEIELASRESGAASFVIFSDIDADDVVISSSGLIGEGSEYKDVISLKYIKRWYRGHDANKTIRFVSGSPILVPDLLVKDDNFIKVDLVKNKNYIKTNEGYLEASDLDGYIKLGGGC